MIENFKLKDENSNQPELIDAHTHVQFAAYKDDVEETISRTLRENIWLVN
ncbi:MAG: hypothetical protein HYW38_01265, partial [Candidatus Colwellbacteria bacterium]|nr:hypothetical protein [Candidatus Colwellbacteria bacterium]